MNCGVTCARPQVLDKLHVLSVPVVDEEAEYAGCISVGDLLRGLMKGEPPHRCAPNLRLPAVAAEGCGRGGRPVVYFSALSTRVPFGIGPPGSSIAPPFRGIAGCTGSLALPSAEQTRGAGLS